MKACKSSTNFAKFAVGLWVGDDILDGHNQLIDMGLELAQVANVQHPQHDRRASHDRITKLKP